MTFPDNAQGADDVQCLTDEERAAICAERGHHRVSQAPSTAVIRPRRCVVCDTPIDGAGEALLPDEVVTPAPRKQVDEDTLAPLIDGSGSDRNG